MSGAMLGSGLVHAVESGGVPYRCGVDASMLTASLNMAIGLLAALERREVSGEGQWVDVSMHDSLLAIKAILRPEIEGGAIRAPFGIFKTCDGHIVICVSRDKQWTGLAGAMGREELSSDPRFIGMGDRCANVRELNGIIQEWLTGKTGEQALQILRKAMVPASLIMNIGELLQDNHLNHRGMVTDLFSTSGEKIEGVKSYGLPIKLSRSPGAFDYPAPAVGAQTGEIFNTLLGITKAELERLRNEGLV
jgi:formyl-CoA transferase